MRKRIHVLVDHVDPHSRLCRIYEWFICAVAILSIVPLLFKGSDANPYFVALDRLTVYILFADYILRWICRDYTVDKKGIKAFLLYPFTPFAIIDMISMLPTLGILRNHFRIFRMLRIFMLFRHSQNLVYFARVFKKEKKTLGSVLVITVLYVFISALTMFTYEPDTFDNFFGALYWATTALTTIGYGDFYPQSTVGQFISMISSLFGIAIIALPSGVITVGFLDEINRKKEEDEKAEAAFQAKEERNKLLGFNLRNTKLEKRIITRYGLIMLVGVALNQVLSFIAATLKLPVWLDTTGTVLTTLILQPAAGLLVGLADNFILAIVNQDSSQIFYYAISAASALIAGLYLKRKGHVRAGNIAPAMLVTVIVSTGLSVLISLMRTGAIVNAPVEQTFAIMGIGLGVPTYLASVFGILVVKTYDVLATAMIVGTIYYIYLKIKNKQKVDIV